MEQICAGIIGKGPTGFQILRFQELVKIEKEELKLLTFNFAK